MVVTLRTPSGMHHSPEWSNRARERAAALRGWVSEYNTNVSDTRREKHVSLEGAQGCLADLTLDLCWGRTALSWTYNTMYVGV